MAYKRKLESYMVKGLVLFQLKCLAGLKGCVLGSNVTATGCFFCLVFFLHASEMATIAPSVKNLMKAWPGKVTRTF